MLGVQVPVPCMEDDPLLSGSGGLTTPKDTARGKVRANETGEPDVEIRDELVSDGDASSENDPSSAGTVWKPERPDLWLPAEGETNSPVPDAQRRAGHAPEPRPMARLTATPRTPLGDYPPERSGAKTGSRSRSGPDQEGDVPSGSKDTRAASAHAIGATPRRSSRDGVRSVRRSLERNLDEVGTPRLPFSGRPSPRVAGCSRGAIELQQMQAALKAAESAVSERDAQVEQAAVEAERLREQAYSCESAIAAQAAQRELLLRANAAQREEQLRAEAQVWQYDVAVRANTGVAIAVSQAQDDAQRRARSEVTSVELDADRRLREQMAEREAASSEAATALAEAANARCIAEARVHQVEETEAAAQSSLRHEANACVSRLEHELGEVQARAHAAAQAEHNLKRELSNERSEANAGPRRLSRVLSLRSKTPTGGVIPATLREVVQTEFREEESALKAKMHATMASEADQYLNAKVLELEARSVAREAERATELAEAQRLAVDARRYADERARASELARLDIAGLEARDAARAQELQLERAQARRRGETGRRIPSQG